MKIDGLIVNFGQELARVGVLDGATVLFSGRDFDYLVGNTGLKARTCPTMGMTVSTPAGYIVVTTHVPRKTDVAMASITGGYDADGGEV